MDHLAPRLRDARESLGQIGHEEVGERLAIAGPRSAGVHAEGRPGGACLPAPPLVRSSIVQGDAEHRVPEATGAGGVVGRELDKDDG